MYILLSNVEKYFEEEGKLYRRGASEKEIQEVIKTTNKELETYRLRLEEIRGEQEEEEVDFFRRRSTPLSEPGEPEVLIELEGCLSKQKAKGVRNTLLDKLGENDIRNSIVKVGTEEEIG